jgi:hypothetical protein
VLGCTTEWRNMLLRHMLAGAMRQARAQEMARAALSLHGNGRPWQLHPGPGRPLCCRVVTGDVVTGTEVAPHLTLVPTTHTVHR